MDRPTFSIATSFWSSRFSLHWVHLYGRISHSWYSRGCFLVQLCCHYDVPKDESPMDGTNVLDRLGQCTHSSNENAPKS